MPHALMALSATDPSGAQLHVAEDKVSEFEASWDGSQQSIE